MSAHETIISLMKRVNLSIIGQEQMVERLLLILRSVSLPGGHAVISRRSVAVLWLPDRTGAEDDAKWSM